MIQASQPVEVRKLGSAERVVASHMAALGLLMPEEVEGTSFLCPTFLAALLCGGPGATAATASTAGYIVVETSFRVYAYTSSPVQVRLQTQSLTVLVGWLFWLRVWARGFGYM